MNTNLPSSLRALAALAALAAAGAAIAEAGDRYPDYAELSKHEKEGVDYRVIHRPGSSRFAVFAIHGGWIEAGTSELAKEIAGSRHGLYSFEGMKTENNFDLHLTSTAFDEPRALELAKRSRSCVSIHGFKDSTPEKTACIGGANLERAKLVAEALSHSGIPMKIEFPCVRLPGTSLQNIVNRCRERGVQLELSSELRNELSGNLPLRKRFANSVRKVFLH